MTELTTEEEGCFGSVSLHDESSAGRIWKSLTENTSNSKIAVEGQLCPISSKIKWVKFGDTED